MRWTIGRDDGVLEVRLFGRERRRAGFRGRNGERSVVGGRGEAQREGRPRTRHRYSGGGRRTSGSWVDQWGCGMLTRRRMAALNFSTSAGCDSSRWFVVGYQGDGCRCGEQAAGDAVYSQATRSQALTGRRARERYQVADRVATTYNVPARELQRGTRLAAGSAGRASAWSDMTAGVNNTWTKSEALAGRPRGEDFRNGSYLALRAHAGRPLPGSRAVQGTFCVSAACGLSSSRPAAAQRAKMTASQNGRREIRLMMKGWMNAAGSTTRMKSTAGPCELIERAASSSMATE